MDRKAFHEIRSCHREERIATSWRVRRLLSLQVACIHRWTVIKVLKGRGGRSRGGRKRGQRNKRRVPESETRRNVRITGIIRNSGLSGDRPIGGVQPAVFSVSYHEQRNNVERNNGGGLYNTYIGTITIKTELLGRVYKGGKRELEIYTATRLVFIAKFSTTLRKRMREREEEEEKRKERKKRTGGKIVEK